MKDSGVSHQGRVDHQGLLPGFSPPGIDVDWRDVAPDWVPGFKTFVRQLVNIFKYWPVLMGVYLDTSLSLDSVRLRSREEMLVRTGSQGVGVGLSVPEIRRIVEFSCVSKQSVWADRAQTQEQYSATE